jgi:hypothetical protein
MVPSGKETKKVALLTAVRVSPATAEALHWIPAPAASESDVEPEPGDEGEAEAVEERTRPESPE